MRGPDPGAGERTGVTFAWGAFTYMLLLRSLGAVASIHLAAGRIPAWIYRKVWGRAPLHWFDHRFDILRGPEFWTWQERGVLGMQVIPAGAKVLDLCCGEGFYDRMYFAERASSVDALDMDGSAIDLAQALNRRRNLRFYKADVAQDNFPDTEYDTILCFSALQQMSRAQLDTLLPKIRAAVKAGGSFFGSVSLIRENLLLRTEDQVRAEFVKVFSVGRAELFALAEPAHRVLLSVARIECEGVLYPG